MFFYYGKTVETSHAGSRLIPVECSNCGCEYFYELARIGTAATTAHYGIGTGRATRKAHERSKGDLQRRLVYEAELVPCPECNWINDDLVEGYRRSRFRRIGVFAVAIGFAGAVLSLACAWYISIGNPADRRALPYFLFGGPAAFISFTVAMFLLRRFLRRRIQPNRNFPSPPTLPFGSPPALLMDKPEGQLRLAQPQQSPADEEDLLDIQFGRHQLPPVCCECLQSTPATGGGHAIQVTRLMHLEIPMCEECFESQRRQFERIVRIVFGLGMLVEFGLLGIMWFMSVEWWIILVMGLVVFGAILAVAAVIASVQTAPAKVVARDRARGVVRLRFRNVDYVELLAQQANCTEEIA